MDYCLKKGKGTPLLFLHGFLGSPEDWLPLINELPPCHCIGMDLPGHGKAPLDKEISAPRAHLIGYSMGGRLAMRYALNHPEKIASLTIISAHRGLTSGKQERLEIDLIWSKKIRENFDAFLKEWYSQSLFANFVPDLEVRREQNPEMLAECLIEYSLAKQELFSLEKALIIVGERDEKYRKLYPEAHVIENAGHQVHLENPKSLAKTLQMHLNL